MRHVRILGLALISAFALAALASSSAMAEKCKLYGEPGAQYCETAKEHSEFQAFRFCPAAASACTWAQSSYKEKWQSAAQQESWEAENGRTAPNLPAHFTAGNITVSLKNTILLQGGLNEKENGELEWVASEEAPTIEPVAQPGPSLKNAIDTSKLSPSELERYNYFTKVAKETKSTATVELAGPASAIQVHLGNLLSAEGTAFVFPVKVKISNNFVGNDCYVGSNEHPIVTEFSSGVSGSLDGKVGFLTFSKPGVLLTVSNNTIVSNTFAVPGAEGCGVNDGADEAIDSALALPAAPGGNSAVLNGTLKQAGREVVQEELEGKI